MPGTPETAKAADRAPDYWLLHRAGTDTTKDAHLNADAAVAIAQRPDAVGDLYERGIVWQEPDPIAYSGFVFVTLTPVWKRR